jgi:hypothetical protein
MLKKARLLTRLTLARRDAPYPMQGRSSGADPRFTFHTSRFTVPESDVRTPLADFFSILLKEFQKASARTAVEGVPREATERAALGHLPPAPGGP